MVDLTQTNFGFLQATNKPVFRLEMLAGRYFTDDSNTCLLKLRQFAEVLAQSVAADAGLLGALEEPQYNLLRRPQFAGVLPGQVASLFTGRSSMQGSRRRHNAYADRLESRYRAARAAVDRLTPALLAKAFRGELVGKVAGDAPAEVWAD